MEENEEHSDLLLAVTEGDVSLVTKLLDSGQDIEAKDSEEKTALFLASQDGDIEMVELLIKRGADTSTRGGTGYTPLHISSENGCLDVVKILLENKVEVNPRENQWGSTPMICASFWGYDEIVSLLLSNGGNPSIEAYFGYTPLCCAAIKGHADVIRVLLLLSHKNAVNIESRTSNGYTALLHAVSNGHTIAVQVLLDHGANINATDSMGIGIINILASKGDEETMRKFHTLGAPIQTCDNNGNSPLHAAIESEHLNIVKYLIENASDINLQNNHGYSPMHIAALKEHMDIIRVLLKAGANCKLRSTDNDTPIDVAYLSGHTQIVDVLNLVSDLSDNICEREKEFRGRTGSLPSNFSRERRCKQSSHAPKPAPRKNTGTSSEAESFRQRADTHPVVRRKDSGTSVSSSVSTGSGQYYIDMASIQNEKIQANMINFHPDPPTEEKKNRNPRPVSQTQMDSILIGDNEEIGMLKKQIEILTMKQTEQEYAMKSMESNYSNEQWVDCGQVKKMEEYSSHKKNVPAPPLSPKTQKKSRNPFRYIFRKNKSHDKANYGTENIKRNSKEPKSTPTKFEDLRISDDTKKLISSVYIEFDRLILGDMLGKGNFGRVYHGTLRSGSLYDKVAVKTAKYRADETDMVEVFLKEALIMKDFKHGHVLSLIGVTFDLEGNPMVVLPYMAHDNLRSYIRDPQKNISVQHLLQLGIQVARGMEYLAARRFIHRDLACRNCMIDQIGDNIIVKVADFGLSRDLHSKDYYRISDRLTPLPVRWMAPEALKDDVFMLESDVWSFGVLLWELLTRGSTPYAQLDNNDVQQHIFKGNRLEKPDYCPDNIYGIMQICWNMDPHRRPKFSELVTDLEDKVYFHNNKK